MDYKNIKFIKRGKKTPINYTGRKFGNLIVIKPLDNYGDFYLFECDCGKQFEGKNIYGMIEKVVDVLEIEHIQIKENIKIPL